MGEILDPFGAPEFLVSGLGRRELICSEIVRLSWFAVEHRDRILKVRLLIPLRVLIEERDRTGRFLLDLTQGRRLM